MDVDLDFVTHRQELFSKTIVSHFMLKLQKYKNLMLKHGINISDHECVNTLHQSRSFEDNIELVLKENSSSMWSYKSVSKIGTRLSAIKLFRWIYQIVQRTKAARVLSHLNDIPSEDVRGTLGEVARDMSVSYEYQLVMLYGDAEVTSLARHAVSCMIAYLNTSRAYFSASDLIIAVLEVKPQTGRTKETLQTREIRYGDQTVCLRWYLQQILKQTGLRMEALVNADTVADVVNVSEHSNESSHHNSPVHSTNEYSEIVTKEEDESSSQVCSITSDKSCKSEIILQNGQMISSCTSNADIDNEVRKAEYVISKVLNTSNDCMNEVPSDNTDSLCYDHGAVGRQNGVSEHSDGLEIDGDWKVCHTQINVRDADGNNMSAFANNSDKLSQENTCRNDLNIRNLNVTVNEQSDFMVDGSLKVGTPDSGGGTSIDSEQNMYISDGQHNISEQDCNTTEGVNTDVNISKNMRVGNSCIDAFAMNGDIGLNTGSENIGTSTDSTLSLNLIETNAKQIVKEINSPVNSDSSESEDKQYEQVVNMRTICAIDMDFEKGKMHIIEHVVEVRSNSSSVDILEKDFTNTSGSCYTDADLSSPLSEQLADTLDEPAIDVTDNGDNNVRNLDEIIEQSADNTLKKRFQFYGCFTPYGAKCCPHIYGFRGPLHVWDDSAGKYCLVYNDTVTVNPAHHRELPTNPDNPHQVYVPKTCCWH